MATFGARRLPIFGTRQYSTGPSISAPIATVTRAAQIAFTAGSASLDANWNQFVGAGNTPTSLTSIVDAKGAATPWSMSQNGIVGQGAAGQTTGNNSGIVPDKELANYWYNGMANGAAAMELTTIIISGLSVARNYNIFITASRGGFTNRPAQYTIGAQNLTFDAGNNTMNAVTFNNIVPDSSGSISVSFQPGLGGSANFGYISAMIITEN